MLYVRFHRSRSEHNESCIFLSRSVKIIYADYVLFLTGPDTSKFFTVVLSFSFNFFVHKYIYGHQHR